MSNESLITIKDLIDLQKEYNISDVVAKHYMSSVDNCFNGNVKNKTSIKNKYLRNSSSIIEMYLKDDFEFLKSKIIHTRKMCSSRLEIEKTVYTLDRQIEILRKSNNHKDLLIEMFRLRNSKDYKERREFNIDIYYDIMDYLIENLLIEQNGYWK